MAKLLTYKVECYCDAVESRRKSLAAVDGFYRELMVCQWRIEAIEAQQRALQTPEALPVPAFEADTEGAEAPAFHLVETCLSELATLRDAAQHGIQERAAHYALASHGPRMASSVEEKSMALEGYLKLADEVFAEASAEMRGLAEQRSAWANLPNSLARRLKFWSCELEETWSNWQDATSRMYSSGHDALCAWREIAEVLEYACQHFEHVQDGGQKWQKANFAFAKAELQSALVTFVARSLEVELLNPLGLCGLHGDGYFSRKEEQGFSLETRLDMLTTVLELLDHLHVLDKVGEELLRLGSESLPLPACDTAAWLGENVTAKAKPDAFVQLQSLASGGHAARVLLPWFIECLVQAVASAAKREHKEDSSIAFVLWKRLDLPSASSLLESCQHLTGHELAEAVKSLAFQRFHPEASCQPKRLQQITKALSSSCARLLDMDALSDDFDTPVHASCVAPK